MGKEIGDASEEPVSKVDRLSRQIILYSRFRGNDDGSDYLS